jgi:hypothetical protein
MAPSTAARSGLQPRFKICNALFQSAGVPVCALAAAGLHTVDRKTHSLWEPFSCLTDALSHSVPALRQLEQTGYSLSH